MAAQRRTEAQLRSRVSRLVRLELGGQFTPVETAGSAGSGVPDVELCLHDGVQAWLELKVHDVADPGRPKKIGHLRREQVRWMRERQRLGGRAGLLVMARWSGSAREYVLLDGRTAADLWLAQHAGDPWSWRDVCAASVVRPHARLSAGWLDDGLDALPVGA